MRFYRAFTLIEIIVGIALMLILFLALFSILRTSLLLSAFAKAKATAIELATTQMEYLRGLSYDELGTAGGIPAGTLPQTATTTVDGTPYTINTFIEYYDDPADGVGVNDTDGTTDYKICVVMVSYNIEGLSKDVSLVSNFAPPGIETSTNGGTLSLHIVDANGAGLGDTTVHIVNASTLPMVDFSTFSNTSGYVVIGGAATSSSYQIYVSKTGDSTAQTYARTNQNVNPNPGYLTVAKDQTTSATFSIDKLATILLQSLSPAVTTSYNDSFADTTELAVQNGTQVVNGELTLFAGGLNGSARSLSLSPSYLNGWGLLSATLAVPSGTSAFVQIDDGAGNPLPDTILRGNSTGFSTFPVSLMSISTSTYPTLSLEALLSSDSTTTAPSVLDWSLSHTSGPIPLSNIGFTLTGAKTIGTDINNAPIYKTVVTDTTGASDLVTESLEWDSYTITIGGEPLIESCPAAPYQMAPGTTVDALLLVGTTSGDTLQAFVQDSTGAAIGDAVVTLSDASYAATVPTSACGLAYFSEVPSGAYNATVTATNHATTTFSNISVTNVSASTTLVLP